MGKEDKKDLLRFMKPYAPGIGKLALWLRDFVWDLYPDSNELIYDNYNAVAFGWSPTDRVGHTFCSIALSREYVHFGFYWGSQIADPEKMLLGKGNQYRYIIVRNAADFPKAYITRLLREAYVNSLAKVKDEKQIMKGKTITKSISPVKKRPGVETGATKKRAGGKKTAISKKGQRKNRGRRNNNISLAYENHFYPAICLPLIDIIRSKRKPANKSHYPPV